MITQDVLDRRSIALAAAFAAVYGTLRLIPISVWIGVPGRVFTATEFFAPVLGIVLGPVAGCVAGVVGTFIGIIITGRMNYFGLDFLTVATNALVLGLLIRRKRLLASLLYLALLALFFAHPSTLNFVAISLPNLDVTVPFLWLHIATWVLLVSPLGAISIEWIRGQNMQRMVTSTGFLVLVGTTAQHLTGSLLFASITVPMMGFTSEALHATWVAIFYAYPFERLMMILGGTTVTVAVIKALRVTRLYETSQQRTSA